MTDAEKVQKLTHVVHLLICDLENAGEILRTDEQRIQILTDLLVTVGEGDWIVDSSEGEERSYE